MTRQALIVLSTAPDESVAASIAGELVRRRLVACVNIVDGVRSVYRWEGAVHDDAEVLMICKTEEDRLEALTTAIEELHPYDCPEVVALPVTGGSAAYLDWIGASLRQ